MNTLFLLMARHDAARRRSWAAPMVKMLPFAIFSTRRLEEMLRIRWDDIDEENRKVLVRSMKHPRKKATNHVWCKLPDRAWAIIQSMPKIDARIFPYGTAAVGAQFQRACDWLDIKDLRLHDMRHEGVSHLFEMDWPIPRVAEVSGNKSWEMLRRYAHLNGKGDRYAGWKWLDVAIGHEVKQRVPAAKTAAATAKPAH